MFVLFASYRTFSFDQNRNFRPFFTTVPNFKNFHRQLSEIFLIESLNFPKISRVQDRYLRMRKPGVLARATY